MIRPFGLPDMIYAVIFLRKVCDELDRDFDLDSTVSSLLRVLGQGHYMKVYAEEGKILGMAVVISGPCFTNEKEIRAVESLWHSDPELSSLHRARIMRELREDMEAFSKSRGFDLYLCPNSQFSKGLGRNLEKHGYTLKESVYLAPKGE